MQRYNRYKTNLEGATLSSINTRIRLGISLRAGPVMADTRVDTRPRTPFSVGLICITDMYERVYNSKIQRHVNSHSVKGDFTTICKQLPLDILGK